MTLTFFALLDQELDKLVHGNEIDLSSARTFLSLEALRLRFEGMDKGPPCKITVLRIDVIAHFDGNQLQIGRPPGGLL